MRTLTGAQQTLLDGTAYQVGVQLWIADGDGSATPSEVFLVILEELVDSLADSLEDMATELDAARLLTQRAAVLKDAGNRVTRESSMAKLYASEVAVRICDEAVQLHGGYGFIKDYPAEKFYRDVKLCTIGEGTSEIQRMVIGREILKVHPSRG